ncbi:VOC family protein [Larkinella humicola]|uniref:VOC family protein n=1 Tax=Larkinella humicola TaxID=2607654 RepID=A0A5N1JEN4_9BACT|nr:VOC family protein [Larkinella humicola]KAA9352776.1 VOC family protein [Larkinella humicola]
MTANTTTTVSPFLTVNNGKAAVDFYQSAFGAIELERHDRPDEKLTSKISIEGAEFFVGDEEPEFGNVSPDQRSSSSVRIILKTQHADELFGKAVTFGATEICPMTTETDWRIGKLKDPFGHIWEIGYTL